MIRALDLIPVLVGHRSRLEGIMKVIAFTRPVPIDAQDSLVELELAQPEFGPSDLLVKVRAVSVNLMGTKVRGARHQGSASDNTAKLRVLGWDAAGVVLDKGAAVIAFGVGDTVYYRRVGSPQIERRIRRPWTNGSSDACQTRSGFAEDSASPKTYRELLFYPMKISQIVLDQ